VGCVQLMRMQYLTLFTPEHGIGGRQIPGPGWLHNTLI
jgi:hypothetical protein